MGSPWKKVQNFSFRLQFSPVWYPWHSTSHAFKTAFITHLDPNNTTTSDIKLCLLTCFPPPPTPCYSPSVYILYVCVWAGGGGVGYRQGIQYYDYIYIIMVFHVLITHFCWACKMACVHPCWWDTVSVLSKWPLLLFTGFSIAQHSVDIGQEISQLIVYPLFKWLESTSLWGIKIFIHVYKHSISITCLYE